MIIQVQLGAKKEIFKNIENIMPISTIFATYCPRPCSPPCRAGWWTAPAPPGQTPAPLRTSAGSSGLQLIAWSGEAIEIENS